MNQERVLMVLDRPHISEKSTMIADKNKQYSFKVLTSATKKEIKVAVEELFKVKVKNVTTINVNGKTKRFRQKEGKRSDWKKAYVSLHPEFDIDFSVQD